MNALNCCTHRCQLALFIIFNMLPQSYLTSTTSASSQIVTTITPTVSGQPLNNPACYDTRCKCRMFEIKCIMNGVYIDIDETMTNYTRLDIICATNTTAKEIAEAQFPYRFRHNEVKFEIRDCAVLPEILRRANINYGGTIRFDDALPVPARFLHNAVGLQRLIFPVNVNSNAVDNLPAQFFHNQSALKELELYPFCEPYEITLPSQIFHTLYGLEALLVNTCITKTVLRNLTAEHFRDTTNLRKLDLGGNSMQTLSSELFATLTELDELTLSGNDLVVLPSGLLRAQAKLIILDLSYNLLQALPPGIFDTTPFLLLLDLRYNRFSVPTNIIATDVAPASLQHYLEQQKQTKKMVLHNLTAEHFRDTSNLRKLDLSYNHMQTLSSELFVTFTELNVLILRNNDLATLPSGLLRAQGKLIILDLSVNQLQALPPDIFNTTPFLWHLDLRYNEFSVPTNIIAAIQPLLYLYRLLLSNNYFTHIAGAGKFQNFTLLSRQQIREISTAPAYFQHYLKQLQRYYPGPYNMTYIDLSYNYMEKFHLSAISAADLRCPYQLDFRNNHIKHIYALSYPPHNHSTCTREIQLQDNPLQCNCATSWLYNTDLLMANSRECVGPDGRNQKFWHASCDTCAWKPRFCPTVCNCQYDAGTLLINCTHSHLKSITELPRPEQVSLTQSTLDISHNRFLELPLIIAPGYANVTRLYAAHNRLENIQSAHLPPQLEVLDVRNNSLKRLSDSFVQHFLNEGVTLQQLYLSENPWLCDCGAEQTLNAVRTHRKRIRDVALLACANLENTSLLQARFEDVCVSESVRLAWLLFSISLVIIVFISLIALYYKYNLEIHVWLYVHGIFLCCTSEHELDKDKTFDAFISYAHQDARFVNDILLPGLEQGEPQFSVCTHERNWLAGAYIPEQIIESVAQSRRTIIVLSQHFIESDWARMEFRTAHQCALNERRSRIIIIKKGELTDMTALDKELRAYLTMNTYLEWVDHPWFWSKLRYAMPHRKGEGRSAGMLELNERRRAYVIGDVERNTLRQLDQ